MCLFLACLTLHHVADRNKDVFANQDITCVSACLYIKYETWQIGGKGKIFLWISFRKEKPRKKTTELEWDSAISLET